MIDITPTDVRRLATWWAPLTLGAVLGVIHPGAMWVFFFVYFPIPIGWRLGVRIRERKTQ